MKSFIFNPSEKWFKGEIILRYNLKTLLKLILFIIILPFAVLYYLGKALWQSACWLGKNLWQGICWLGRKLWPVICGLGLLLLAFWTWLKGLFRKKAKPAEDPQTATSDRRRNWMWLLILLLLLLGSILTWRSCTSKNNADEPSAAPAQVYDNSFDRVIVARAYLDGVQTTVSKDCPRALVGFKFINNQPVKDFNFTGMTYEQAIQVVAEDWKPLVVDNLSADVKLSEQQMAVVTLVAMRMGKNGFPRSTFLQKVNEGDFDAAGKWLLLQKKNGEIRKVGEEPTQYFYMLKLLWNNQLQIDDLLDLPMFSYRALPLDSLYHADGSCNFNEHIQQMLKKGNFTTPRTALEL